MIPDNEQQKRALIDAVRWLVNKFVNQLQVLPVLWFLPKQPKVDLKHGLEQTHVGTLVESNLMFP